MSIDGIGRPPVPPPGARPTEGSAPGGNAETFHIDRGAGASASAVETSATGLLERLERGELTLDQYLDFRVDEAIAPFASRLPSEKLEFLRSSLRAELESDPVLVELVRHVHETPRESSR